MRWRNGKRIAVSTSSWPPFTKRSATAIPMTCNAWPRRSPDSLCARRYSHRSAKALFPKNGSTAIPKGEPSTLGESVADLTLVGDYKRAVATNVCRSAAHCLNAVIAYLHRHQCGNIPHNLGQLARVDLVEEAVELDMLRYCRARAKQLKVIPK